MEQYRTEQERVDGLTCRIEVCPQDTVHGMIASWSQQPWGDYPVTRQADFQPSPGPTPTAAHQGQTWWISSQFDHPRPAQPGWQNPNIQGSGFIRHPPQRPHKKQHSHVPQPHPNAFAHSYEAPSNPRFSNQGYQHPRGGGGGGMQHHQQNHQQHHQQHQHQRYMPRGGPPPPAPSNVPPPPPGRIPPPPHHHPHSSGYPRHMYPPPHMASSGMMNGMRGPPMLNSNMRMDMGRPNHGMGVGMNGGNVGRMEGGRSNHGMGGMGAEMGGGRGGGPSWYGGPLSRPPMYQNGMGGYPPPNPGMPPPMQMMQQGFPHGMPGGEMRHRQAPHMQQAPFTPVAAANSMGSQYHAMGNGQVHQPVGMAPAVPPPAPPAPPVPPPPPPPRPIQAPQVPIFVRDDPPVNDGCRSPTINYQPPPPHKAPAPIGTPLPGSYVQKAAKAAPQIRPVSKFQLQPRPGNSPTPNSTFGSGGVNAKVRSVGGGQEMRLPLGMAPRSAEVNRLASDFGDKVEIQSANGNRSLGNGEEVLSQENGEKGSLTKRQKTRLRKKMREAHLKNQGSGKKGMF
ncbi:hypothetical protein BSKO_08423 [Bryopsis sp. KO-2023]|nr:hypothetical protein BSKO_08423 [Bryopsis sp. KO-2023]